MRVGSLEESILELAVLRSEVNHSEEALSHHRLVRRQQLKYLTEQSNQLLTESLSFVGSSRYSSLCVHADEGLLLHLLFRHACFAQDTVAEEGARFEENVSQDLKHPDDLPFAELYVPNLRIPVRALELRLELISSG